jgi:hypothetical protein
LFSWPRIEKKVEIVPEIKLQKYPPSHCSIAEINGIPCGVLLGDFNEVVFTHFVPNLL